LFKGLTKRVQRILSIEAQDVARHFNAEQLAPEHLIIAVLKEGIGTACDALKFFHINIAEFRHTIEKGLPPCSGDLRSGDLPPSGRIKKILEIASGEARNLGNDYIGTEHILLAAVQEQGSPVQIYLNQQTVDSDMLRVLVQTNFNHADNSQNGDDYGGSGPYAPRYEEIRTGEHKSFYTPRIKPVSYPVLTPTLDEFSRDLTALARAGKLDPIVGRRKEIDRAMRILARRTKNNPVLTGEPGVGKTAIVEGLAQLFAGDDIPDFLAGRRILSLDLGSVVAGTKYRGEFEERLKKVIKEISQAQNVIIFIDEIHTIIGAGGAEGTMDAANMLKPALSRGDIQCIGATTLMEYRKYFEKDAALERRFQAILVDEPDFDETLEILRGIQKRYENHHGVRYTPEAVNTAANLARRYLIGRFMPDKAIDILDEAGAMKKLEIGAVPPEISGIEEEILRLIEEKKTLVSSQDYEKAAELRDRVRNLRSHLESTRLFWERAFKKERMTVDAGYIRKVVAEITGIPLSRLEEQESKRLLNIEKELHQAVVGQDDAVRRIASTIRRSRVGISSPRRPLGSFIFLGPTGVGKTLLAKRLAEYLFKTEDSLVRIDMSDYMEKHNASRLVGAPPGYIGYEDGGALTERIRRNPYRVILFDEIEKAHRDVFNLLLQVLEEGELKDSLGHTVNFRNTVIIMTSNAGVREIHRDSRMGFGAGTGLMSYAEIETAALAELRRFFNPEFINRVDEVVIFHALDRKQVEAIMDLQLEEFSRRLAEQGYGIRLQPSARRIIIEKGWDPKFGGRPMRRAIQKELEDPFSMLLLENSPPQGTVFKAYGKNGKVRFKPELKTALVGPLEEIPAAPVSR
jgi:ATP-dependent Clp protease ATP-binding subunit ClpC